MIVDGDPSQDVKYASVIFLVDAKLVLLQPSTNQGDLKYDMRIVANRVEYFDFMRNRAFPFDSPTATPSRSPSHSPSPNASAIEIQTNRSLRNSLWYFDGNQVHCWMDVANLLRTSSLDNATEILPPVTISTDFYPSSIVINKGVILGVESELSQRRDLSFALFRHDIRVSIISFVYPLFHALII